MSSTLSPSSLITASIRQIRALLMSKQLSVSELLHFHLKQIKAHNSALNALRFINDTVLLREISSIQSALERGEPLGRLHGLFFTAKDSFHVAGLPRSDGSRRSVLDASPTSSALIERLTQEGALCIGKANMAEYGKSYYTENPLFGRTHNPFNTAHSPGGSGGGDAAAVACGFAQFGMGADSGGSIRVPANFCGLFGLFPTRATLSDAGPGGFAHSVVNLFRNPGPLTKSLDDLEILYSILSGFDSRDANSVEIPMEWRTAPIPSTRRFAYFSTINGVRADPIIQTALAATVARFESQGWQGCEITPAPCAASYEIFIVLAGQASLILEDLLAEASGSPRDLSQEGPAMTLLRHRISTELAPLTVPTLLKAWFQVSALRDEMARFFQEYSFLLSPVAAGLAPLHGTTSYEVDGQVLQSQQHFQYASMVNTLGLPAIAFPTGISPTGLPIGLQIIGPRFSERLLFKLLRSVAIEERPAELVPPLM